MKSVASDHHLRAMIVALLTAAVVALSPSSARAQVTNCAFKDLHENCTNTSAPNVGKWAWNPGTSFSVPVPGMKGNIHWWIAWKWTSSTRLSRFQSSNPRYEVEFYKPAGALGLLSCGCGNIKALQVRTLGHVNPPPLNSFDVTIKGGDCVDLSPDKSLVLISWKRTAWASLNTSFDLSVDAEFEDSEPDPGEANLSWQNDITLRVDCEDWLGKIEYCSNGQAHGHDPNGILCSTSNFNTGCTWSSCPE